MLLLCELQGRADQMLPTRNDDSVGKADCTNPPGSGPISYTQHREQHVQNPKGKTLGKNLRNVVRFLTQ